MPGLAELAEEGLEAARGTGWPPRAAPGSGRRKKAPTRLTSESAAAASPGAASEYPASSPPTAGPKTKPSPKAAPIMPMPLARPSGRGHVGHVGLGDGDVGGGGAGEEARHEQHREAGRQPVEQEGQRGHGDGDEQHRPSPHPVGEAPPDGREDELHEGVAGAEPAGGRLGGSQVLGVDRHHRDDHPEAEQVDEDDEEEDAEGGLAFHGGGPYPMSGPITRASGSARSRRPARRAAGTRSGGCAPARPRRRAPRPTSPARRPGGCRAARAGSPPPGSSARTARPTSSPLRRTGTGHAVRTTGNSRREGPSGPSRVTRIAVGRRAPGSGSGSSRRKRFTSSKPQYRAEKVGAPPNIDPRPRPGRCSPGPLPLEEVGVAAVDDRTDQRRRLAQRLGLQGAAPGGLDGLQRLRRRRQVEQLAGPQHVAAEERVELGGVLGGEVLPVPPVPVGTLGGAQVAQRVLDLVGGRARQLRASSTASRARPSAVQASRSSRWPIQMR